MERNSRKKAQKSQKKEIERKVMTAGGVQISMQIGTPSWSPASKS
jgi:hypothetical protein